MSTSTRKTFLGIVSECDNFPYAGHPSYTHTISTLFRFTHTTPASTFSLGYITPQVLDALLHLPPHLSSLITIDIHLHSVSLISSTPTSRTSDLASILDHWCANETFSILSGWRDERYAIYAPSSTLFASIERAGAPLFGVVAYCVYLICYSSVENENGESNGEKEQKIWISQRSRSKQTWPGMLDVTVAGAMPDTDTSAFDCMAREAFEEASLPVEMVKDKAREVGRVSYFGVSDGRKEHGGGEKGLCCPEVGVVFEMEVEGGMEMRPGDGEVQGFMLFGVEEVKGGLEKGMFKGNSGAVMVDWLRGRGMLGDEANGSVGGIVKARMRRELDFPVM